MAARALRSPGLLMKCCEAVTGITEKLIKDNALVVGKAAMSDCNPPCSFTDSEIKFYYKQFIKYDKDRDGKLSRWELNELYREKYGRQMNATDLERVNRCILQRVHNVFLISYLKIIVINKIRFDCRCLWRWEPSIAIIPSLSHNTC